MRECLKRSALPRCLQQLLTEKNGSNTPASRARQEIANKGVHQSLIEWTRGKVETDGFKLVVEAGLPEHTRYSLVIRYASLSVVLCSALACG